MKKKSHYIKFVDLFAGIGGIRLGFEQACTEMTVKAECVLSSEINADACETYRLNFDHSPAGDVRLITEIPEFDFLLAGFPCQPFSYAGKRLGFGDTRGTLFGEIERILKLHKPRAFLLENVRGLTTHDGGRTFGTIIESLKELGYGVGHLLLNSCDFDVPQNRMRIYIVGLLESTPHMTLVSSRGPADSHAYKRERKPSTLFPDFGSPVCVRDILEPNINGQYRCSPDFIQQLAESVAGDFEQLHGYRLIDYRGGNSLHSWELGTKGVCTQTEIEFMNHLISNRRKKTFGRHQDGKMLTLDQIRVFYDREDLLETIESLKCKGYLKEIDGRFNPVCGNMSFEVFKFLDPESISITLTSSDAHRLGVVQDNVPRRITPRECARLQGFPDSFICHPNDSAAYQQFGNSVSVPVVAAVVSDFLRQNWLR